MKNGKCCMSMEVTALLVVATSLLASVIAVFFLTLADKAASLIEFTENMSYIFAFMLIFVVFALVRRRGERTADKSGDIGLGNGRSTVKSHTESIASPKKVKKKNVKD